MPPRFYISNLPDAGFVTLGEHESVHLSRARRIGIGEAIWLFDGRDARQHRAVVRSIESRRVTVELTGEACSGEAEPSLDVTLATCAPKGERLDWLVEKAVEVGVSRLVILSTERAVVDPRPAKVDRLRRAVVEASKQCGRNRLMEVAEPVPFAELVAACDSSTRLLACRNGAAVSAVTVAGSITLAVGPEGGFAPSERAQAAEHGWRPVSLGTATMRVETAGVVGVAMLLAKSTEA